jgi:hypothetical protein
MAIFTVNDHAILFAGQRLLNQNGELLEISFAQNQDFVEGTNFARPIIFFKALPNGASKFRVTVGQFPPPNTQVPDGDNIEVYELGTGDNDDEQERTLHSFIRGSRFAGVGSRTLITFQQIRGSIRISEVFLLFQTRIDTALN